MAKYTLHDVSENADARFGVACCTHHRCRRHDAVPLLNGEEETGAECGGCIIEQFGSARTEKELCNLLDGFAGYLVDHARLGQRLSEAYTKLNLIESGLGDDLRQRQLADEMRRIARLEEQDQLRDMTPEGGVS